MYTRFLYEGFTVGDTIVFTEMLSFVIKDEHYPLLKEGGATRHI